MLKYSLRLMVARVGLSILTCLPFGAGATVPASSSLGDKLANDGNYAAAANAFAQELRKSPRDADVVGNLARADLLGGHNKQAVELAKQAVALQPMSAKYQLLLGDALGNYVNDVGLFSKLSIAHQIHDAYQQAVELDPGNTEARFSLALFYLMAPSIAGGSDTSATEQLEALVKLDAAMADTARAQKAFGAKQYAQAEDLFRKAAAAAKDSSGYVTLGEFLETQKRPADALAAFQKAIDDYPKEPEAYYQIGKLTSEGKADAKAGIKALSAYLGISIDWRQGDAPYCWAHFRLAQIYARTGDTVKAKDEYQQALNLNPDFKEARQAFQKLAAS